ncbi:MAG: lytic murein transglycosylase [Proteobacteria bacterium]|nr:lytic murein transglycosylase [Pseudomonadota bacterium]
MKIFFLILLGTVLLGLQVPAFPAAMQDFSSWLQDLRHAAIQYGISQKLVDEALPDTLVPDERVLRLDSKQPENTVSFERYKKNTIAAVRLQTGRQYMRQYQSLLKRVGNLYRVDPQYIVALWGIETSFGQNVGGFETIPALTTLAYDGRRSEFFRRELLIALKIVDHGDIGLHAMKGSWAGAMGQCQFMPSSFEKYAQDYNKDGKRDIWNTREDVFASTAAYLSAEGWQRGQPFMRLVRLPKSFDNRMMGLNIQKSARFWQDAGVRLANGQRPPADTCSLGSIIQPGGKGYKTYIVYNNYRIIMKWNYSTYFATAVGLFADQLKLNVYD